MLLQPSRVGFKSEVKVFTIALFAKQLWHFLNPTQLKNRTNFSTRNLGFFFSKTSYFYVIITKSTQHSSFNLPYGFILNICHIDTWPML